MTFCTILYLNVRNPNTLPRSSWPFWTWWNSVHTKSTNVLISHETWFSWLLYRKSRFRSCQSVQVLNTGVILTIADLSHLQQFLVLKQWQNTWTRSAVLSPGQTEQNGFALNPVLLSLSGTANLLWANKNIVSRVEPEMKFLLSLF